MSSHQSPRAKSVTWLTPPEWIKALGAFDLDPCCPAKMPWETAARSISPRAECGVCDGCGIMRRQWFEQPRDCIYCDGLARPWWGRVWLNPPFGQEWPKWVEKLADHGNGIALIPARTETREFYRLVWDRADGICFVRGRPHFHRPTGERAPFNSGAPIALVAYGQPNVAALEAANLGRTVRLN